MFSATIREAARGNWVYLEVLAELQFVSQTMYLHPAGGVLKSRDPDTGALEDIAWNGLQGLARISNLGASRIGQSRQVTCTLNAEDSQIKELFADQEAEVKGRKFRFWGQFYTHDLAPLDPRFHIYTGTGDRLRMQKSGPSSRVITLFLEDRLVRRRRTAAEMVTHSDQQARDPGSTGFIFVNQMIDQTLNLFDARN